jgi:hypothetical protein
MDTEHKFKAGMDVILCSGNYGRLSRGKVDRVHKNGNFTLVGSPQQWKQSGSHTGPHSYCAPVILDPTPESEARYVEYRRQLALSNRLAKVKAVLAEKKSLDEATLQAIEMLLGVS